MMTEGCPPHWTHLWYSIKVSTSGPVRVDSVLTTCKSRCRVSGWPGTQNPIFLQIQIYCQHKLATRIQFCRSQCACFGQRNEHFTTSTELFPAAPLTSWKEPFDQWSYECERHLWYFWIRTIAQSIGGVESEVLPEPLCSWWNVHGVVIRNKLRWFLVLCCCVFLTQDNNYSKFITLYKLL